MLAGSARGSSATAANKTPKRMVHGAFRPAQSGFPSGAQFIHGRQKPQEQILVAGTGRHRVQIRHHRQRPRQRRHQHQSRRGTAVKAADAGTVAYAGNELKGFGNLILVRHNDGWITAYAHNDRLLVKKGQKVRRGEKIATVGATGGVNSPQLHFEIRAGKKAVNPVAYLP